MKRADIRSGRLKNCIKSLFQAAALSRLIRGKLKAYDHGFIVFVRSKAV